MKERQAMNLRTTVGKYLKICTPLGTFQYLKM